MKGLLVHVLATAIAVILGAAVVTLSDRAWLQTVAVVGVLLVLAITLARMKQYETRRR